jgi:hypothetical protein
MKSITRATLQTFTAILFVFGSAHSVSVCRAQDRGDAPKIVGDERDFETRANILRGISETKPPAKTERPRAPEEALAAARADYIGIQVTNKSLKPAIAADTPLDLQFISNSIADIRKRAERLSSTLALPKPDKDAEHVRISAAGDAQELKTSLASLSTLIRSFVNNPCFRGASLTNSPETRKARLDLEDIIALSKQLQKDSEKLEKAAANARGQ